MEREKLDEIIRCLNSDIDDIGDYIRNINRCCKLVGIDSDEVFLEEEIQNIENDLELDKIAEKLDRITEDIISSVEESLKLEDEDYFYDKLKDSLIAYIGNDRKKEKLLPRVNKDWRTTVILSFQDDDKRISLLDNLLDVEAWEKAEVIASIKNDEKKIGLLGNISEDRYKAKVIVSIQDDEKKIGLLGELSDDISEESKVEVIKSIQDDDKKISLMKELLEDVEEWGELDIREEIIISLQDDDKKISLMKELLEHVVEWEKSDIIKDVIKTLQNDDKKIGLLGEISDDMCKAEIMESIPDIIQVIKKKNLPKEYYRLARLSKNRTEYIRENLEFFLEQEGGVNPGEVEEKKRILLEMYEKNEDILNNIDFRLLDDKYLSSLGQDKINIITAFPDIQQKILELDNKQYEIFSKCLNKYLENNEIGGWRNLTEKLLENISEYNEVLKNTKEFSESDIERATSIFQMSNTFDIKTIEELRNYNDIKRKKCDQVMSNSSSLSEKKKTLLYKIYGHDMKYATSIIRRYGEDIEQLQESDERDYVLSLKEIFGLEDEKLVQKLYYNILEMDMEQVNLEAIENGLKREYCKLYNDGLLKVGNLDQIEENIYDAGTDFRIILNSVSAYERNKNSENYKEDWNRPSLQSPHVCCSYIRNDMLGTAPIHGVCYGFSEMSPNSLALSDSQDIYSNRYGIYIIKR